nr:MAG TPA: hypothetical protein [Caudoviricetes sp.]
MQTPTFIGVMPAKESNLISRRFRALLPLSYPAVYLRI